MICGFGRLGTPFGSNYYGLEPDLMTIAKGLTSGYLPMSACLVSERVWEEIRERSRDQGPFAHGYTYSGHPTPAAVAIANLDLMERERLFDRAASTGAYLQQRLRELASHPLVGEVRGVGMIAGVELVASKAEKKPFPPAVLGRRQGLAPRARRRPDHARAARHARVLAAAGAREERRRSHRRDRRARARRHARASWRRPARGGPKPPLELEARPPRRSDCASSTLIPPPRV